MVHGLQHVRPALEEAQLELRRPLAGGRGLQRRGRQQQLLRALRHPRDHVLALLSLRGGRGLEEVLAFEGVRET